MAKPPFYTTTLGDVMRRNGVKFPMNPDMTHDDLDRARREGVPVNKGSAFRLRNDFYCYWYRQPQSVRNPFPLRTRPRASGF